jgi:hypothetical protein
MVCYARTLCAILEISDDPKEILWTQFKGLL